ncbi:putative radical SAM enzyme (TIGR03279 family) [Caldanaerobacter subterraneus subsp. tengcongensis MB4]|uniref:Fe-S oxidoreductase, related to NifB/MoaA family n=1 Tax=Caldanaerobacter subterraneus subsp. tengcongensis (strain DSM 15242 / JCM 11007 / NBRC 100824 / MB4) TaxID=273068 RepID=Q8R9J0_CALS4|nr:radical SAM protein [Caldanaerobacter subterraneus]AAM24822.1 Fe-S oxidoreductase, related to NifB/MoaA family [Caldanaerobacter subterraneus subsp. tengcongensis MB4]MCS3915608.1 putative radical SAM enzyme (TIGR03279 family) [Caldanaerobacter subterraneus subsp. tengcongensis MB4]
MQKINIKDVIKGSIAEELGIQKGDKLISLNGREVIDIIDYRYEMANEFVQVEIEKISGERYVFEIEKDYNEDIGLVFEEEIIDRPKRCRNKCIFCFIDQLPKGVRKSLLFKDDDYRLSFLQGNFITLTNMNEEEIDRIIKYRLSPIYVSIHTTDGDLRVRMMRNPNARNIMENLKKLVNNGIEVHGQIVLCPEINDGAELDKTIKDLSDLYSGVKSVAVVPVGLTDHRHNLYPLRPFTIDEAREVVEQVSSWQEKLKARLGTSFVFLSDEFYVIGDLPIPDYDHYEDFPQIENGVGLMALFKHQFEEAFQRRKRLVRRSNKPYLIVTGIAAYDFMRNISQKLKSIGFDIEVMPIVNKFFGKNITVAGLVVGKDIIEQLKGKAKGKTLVIPRVMLKEGSDIFLDDVKVREVEDALGAEVIVSEVDGREFLQKIYRGR